MLTRAIVRPPGESFAKGITTAALGAPRLSNAVAQHERYCHALERCGLTLTRLEPDAQFPDSTFVEDTAVLTDRVAVLARPGAESRRDEVAAIRETLGQFYETLEEIRAPGTLDGGDVCQAGNHFFIGISRRTNAAGAKQLAGILAEHGYSSSHVDIRDVPALLHLKSGLACVDDELLVLHGELRGLEVFAGHEMLVVDPAEVYGANCVRVNEHVLMVAGHPRLEAALRARAYPVIPLEMSEFWKMDGGPSCLSLRF